MYMIYCIFAAAAARSTQRTIFQHRAHTVYITECTIHIFKNISDLETIRKHRIKHRK